ncbi:MAG: Lrp/AsnC ligand binding domain-containing protein [Thaumarchaeota archaeon]|nr:Lrp/AsnC ligand binding domain-containing protein [Nitrososphaerota archaeon]RNJ73397.1 MAG: Lrp/AsnC family transcriptional regulator [Thaumarchaeota archaeon S13]RNJ74148.1 MAG: Lrp/AsnC family transcriptional regulator [Thaumarchaeota archaeon S14]RNJ75268.1 MAG: Lrp/AsnC family transcriptional regulator [Thaumarchaeota archaeon S15]MDD9808924.1 Lrp/AsnC ligand binding domain-containing protein [Nitrososphaerota archaeon]
MVKAVILVKSPKRLIAAKLRKISLEAFPVSGQFDAVLIVDVEGMSEVRDVVARVQAIGGVERTETMMEVQ